MVCVLCLVWLPRIHAYKQEKVVRENNNKNSRRHGMRSGPSGLACPAPKKASRGPRDVPAERRTRFGWRVELEVSSALAGPLGRRAILRGDLGESKSASESSGAIPCFEADFCGQVRENICGQSRTGKADRDSGVLKYCTQGMPSGGRIALPLVDSRLPLRAPGLWARGHQPFGLLPLLIMTNTSC